MVPGDAPSRRRRVISDTHTHVLFGTFILENELLFRAWDPFWFTLSWGLVIRRLAPPRPSGSVYRRTLAVAH